MKAVFVLGTFERDALKKGDPLTQRTVELLQDLGERFDLDVEVVIALQDELYAGRSKKDIGIGRVREERPRVLSEISAARPGIVVCFGPVATMAVFDHGSLTEDSLSCAAHYPLGPEIPVYCTVGIEALRWAPGLRQWLYIDMAATVYGQTETEWGDYTVLQPGTPEWQAGPVNWSWEGQQPVLALDTETFPGLNYYSPDARVRMVQFSDMAGRAWVVQLTEDSDMPQWLRGLLEDPSIIKVGSNIKYDYKWLRRFGVRMRNFEDTSTREHLIDQTNPRKDLKSLTLKYLPRLGDYSRPHKNLVAERSKEAGDRDRWDLVRDDEQYQYAAADAEASIAAWLGQEPQLADLQRPRQIHKQLYEVLAEMEFVGACVDLQENRRLDKEYRRKMSEVAAKITRVLGPINLNSPDQLKRALLKHVPGIDLGTNREWRQVMSEDESEELSTRRDILERETVKHPVIKDVLDYRKYEKRHTNYIRLMRKKHISEHHGQTFVHGSYRTDMADTYRLTSSSPPMHNIAKDDSDEPELSVKRQFVSRWPGGSILACDLAQAEFRFAAWESQDQAMIDAITAGGDIHREMAARGIGKEPEQVTDDERYIYKTITFLTMYGGRARKLVETLAKSDKVQTVTMPQARALIRNYFGTFQGLKGYIDEVGERAVRDLMVETAFGYRRYFQSPESREDRWAIQRYAFNTRIQNGASILADLALVWMQNAIEKRKLHSRIIIFRHDEYVLDVYPGEEQEIAELARFGMEVACIEAAKEYGVDFTVPLSADVKIGPSWGETKPMEVKLLGKENF